IRTWWLELLMMHLRTVFGREGYHYALTMTVFLVMHAQDRFFEEAGSMAKEELLHEGRFLRLKRCGHWEFAERVNARAAVAIVAVTDADELVLVEQPRLPVDSAVIELPAGLVGDIPGAGDEPLATAATRELEE